MNREGKTYRSDRGDSHPTIKGAFALLGSIVLVTQSTPWSPDRPETSNYTHACLVLECPLAPTEVGRSVSIDERLYTRNGVIYSSFKEDDLWVEI